MVFCRPGSPILRLWGQKCSIYDQTKEDEENYPVIGRRGFTRPLAGHGAAPPREISRLPSDQPRSIIPLDVALKRGNDFIALWRVRIVRPAGCIEEGHNYGYQWKSTLTVHEQLYKVVELQYSIASYCCTVLATVV